MVCSIKYMAFSLSTEFAVLFVDVPRKGEA